MPTFEHAVAMDAPIDQVFAFGTDPENWRRTMPGLTAIENVAETEDGLRMDATYELLGTSMDGQLELSIVEPNERTITTFESPGMSGQLEYRYEETAEGTMVVQRADYEFGDSLVSRVMAPVASRYNKRQFKNSLETSKELVETEVKTGIEA